LGHAKEFKNGICCFSCFNAAFKSCAEDKDKVTVSGLYVSEKYNNSVLTLYDLSSYAAP